MKRNTYEREWNLLDRMIAKVRYKRIDSFVDENTVIVDIGCGRDGAFLHRHEDRILLGYGFDLRQTNHREGKIQFINNSDTDRLELDGEIADTVFLIAVLEHLIDADKIIAECSRLLKKGGEIVLTTPTPKSKWLLETMAFKLHIINEAEILEHNHYWSEMEIADLLERNGIIIEKYKKFWLGLNSVSYGYKK